MCELVQHGLDGAFKFWLCVSDLECAIWLVLLVLGRPQQLNLDMQLPVWFKVDPDLMKGLLRLPDQVGEGKLAVGDKVVGGNGGAAEISEFSKF